jgi:hypothetical protein
VLTVDSFFQRLIPPLTDGELSVLEASILKEGCREPLVIWKDHGIIVDGHNRYAICEKYGLAFRTVEQEFEDRDDVVRWMCVNQLGRRNLTDLARADLRGIYHNSIKRKLGRPKKRAQNEPFSGRTDVAVAALDGVNKSTVKRDVKLAESLDLVVTVVSAERSDFTSGQRKIRRGDILELAAAAAEDPDAAQRAWAKVVDQGPTCGAIRAALREVRNEAAAETLVETSDALVEIINGDFYEESASLAVGSVDAIITDPPYPQQYLPLWDQLGEMAMRTLKPGGWCIAYSGKQHLDQVIRKMTDAGLAFYWQIIFKQTVTATIHARKVNTTYKPILVFQKPPITPPESYFMDIIQGHGIEKDGHEWQQSENGFATLIEQFTNVGDLIVEPFAGAGTCPAVAKKLNRRCIAYEIDEGSHAISCQRVFGTKVD